MNLNPKWKNHPLALAGQVELVPTAWLYQFRGTDVTPGTDLKDGSPASIDQLWENIKLDGLYDPVIIWVGKGNKKFRLESGNHRIQVLMKYGVPFTPAVVQVQELCGPQVKNIMTDATHNFDFTDDVTTEVLKVGYLKPTSVFKSLVGNVEVF